MRRAVRRRAAALLAGALALCVLGGCGGGSGAGTKVRGGELVIYSSAPQRGPSAAQGRDVDAGARLALDDAGQKAGKFKVRYVALDASGDKGRWDPARVSANARRAAANPRTIAYIGEIDPEASAISIPILNKEGILQVSPLDTAEGLTRTDGAGPGEPDKYYPSKGRNFARIVPADHVQAAATATYMKARGVTKVFLVSDRSGYGNSLGRQVADKVKNRGIAVAGSDFFAPGGSDDASLTSKIQASGADAVYVGADQPSDAVSFVRALHAAAPQVSLFGPARLAVPSFTKAIGPAGSVTFLTDPTLDPKLYPPKAAPVFKAFKARYGREARPEALYGYEAMAAVLEAIKAAGDAGNDRKAVTEAFFATKDRESVLGTYSIDGDGDTSLTDYGGYRVRSGAPVFDRVLRPAG